MPSTARKVTIPPSATEWTTIDGLPGSWRRLRTRLAVSARAADEVVVDGRLVDGLQLLRPASDGVPSQLVVAGRCIELVDDGVGVLRVESRCA